MRDHRAAEVRGADGRDDVFVRESVEAVAPDAPLPERARQRQTLRHVRHPPVKGGVEARDLRDVREPSVDRGDPLERDGKVQRRERDERP